MPEATKVAAKERIAAGTIGESRSPDEAEALPSPRTVEGELLRSQRVVGNQAVQRLIRTHRSQPKDRIQTRRQPAPIAPEPAGNDAATATDAPIEARATPASAPPPIQRDWDWSIGGYQFDPSISGVKTAVGLVKDAATSGLDWVADQITSAVNSGMTWLNEKWDSVQKLASSAWDTAKNALASIVGLIKSPLGFLADAMMNMDGQAVAKAYAKFSALVTTVADGFKKTAETFLQPVTSIWNGMNGYATGLLSRVAGMTENFLFKKLPNAVQKVVFDLIDKLKALWKKISDGWTTLLAKIKAWVDTAIDKVAGFVRKVGAFGIDVVVKGIIETGKVLVFMKDFIANPMKYITIMAQQSVQAFNGVESKFAGLINQYFPGTEAAPAPAGGAPARAGAPATIQRQPAPASGAETKRSAEWNEIGHGVGETMGKKWSEFKSDPLTIVLQLLRDLVFPMIGNFEDVTRLYKEVKAIVTGPLGASSLDEFWTSLLKIADIPILIYRTIISILMRSLMIPLVVATFVPHPVVKGIAAAVGWGLLGGFLQGELLNIGQKIALLKTGKTTKAEKDEYYNKISDSLIGLAMAAVITLVMLILHFIANVMKGIYNFVRGKVFSVKPVPVEAKDVKPADAKGGEADGKGKDTKPVDNDPTGVKSPTVKEGPTADGKGSIKVLEDGRVIVCRSCAELRVKYDKVLNPEPDTKEAKAFRDELAAADGEKNPDTKLTKEKAIEQKLRNAERAAETLPQKLEALKAESKAAGDAIDRLDPKGKNTALTEPDPTIQKAKVTAKPAEVKAADAKAKAETLEGDAKTKAEAEANELSTQAQDIRNKIAQLEKAIGEAKGEHAGLKDEAAKAQKEAEDLQGDASLQTRELVDLIRDELEAVTRKAQAVEQKIARVHQDLKEALGEGKATAKPWTHGSITKLPRQNIGGHQVEVHVDERGPHVHLDRNTAAEQYINLKGKTAPEGLSELPEGVKDVERVQTAVEKAIDQWESETK